MSTPAHSPDLHDNPADQDASSARHLLLWEHLRTARWYGGKGRAARLTGLTPLPWTVHQPAGLHLRTEIATVSYADGDLQHYQLLLAYRPVGAEPGALGTVTLDELGEVDVFDAARDQEAMSAWLTAFTPGTRGEGERVGFAHHLVDGAPLDAGLEPRIFGGEQSNTSVMFADVAMVKLFRRLELGRNLDIEVHEAFGKRASKQQAFTGDAGGVTRDGGVDAADLYGWTEAWWPREGDDGEVVFADLAMVVEQLRGARDAWEVALEHCRTDTDFTAEAARLGIALAGVHRALQQHFPSGTLPGALVADAMNHRLDRALEQALELAPYADALRDRFATIAHGDLDVQRVHGDFHLGQVLFTQTGPKIIDFEGEPLKTMAERVLPDSPWRDVAGLIRSFDYAAGTVALETPHRAAAARGWAADCTAALLSAYRAATGATASTDSTAADADVAAAYIADKAIYEVVYEVRNRPGWAAIPLAAIAALTTADDPAASAQDTTSDEGTN